MAGSARSIRSGAPHTTGTSMVWKRGSRSGIARARTREAFSARPAKGSKPLATNTGGSASACGGGRKHPVAAATQSRTTNVRDQTRPVA